MSSPLHAREVIERFGRVLLERPLLLTAGFALLYTATFDAELGSPDEGQRFNLAVELARRGLGALEGSAAMSRYPPLQSLLAAPLVSLGLHLDGGAPGQWTHRLGIGLSLLCCVVLIPLFYGVARLLDAPPRRAALATFLFGLTNPVWPYSKRFFSEPLTAALALGAVAGALAFLKRGGAWRLALGLACLALMPLNNYVLPLAIGAGLGLLFLVERRPWLLVPLAGATVAGGALLAGTNVAIHGKVVASGYPNDRFTFEVLEGLHGLLFGWGRSIFVYAPMLLLSLLGARMLWRRWKAAAVLVLSATVVTLLVIASWSYWWGGICWGPRLVLPILPIASLGAALFLVEPRPWKTTLAWLVGLAGLYVQLMGVAFKHDFDIYFWMKPDYSDERKAWFDWEYSAVRRMPGHFRDHPWDLSSVFLTLEPTGPSRVELDGAPVKRLELRHRGDALFFHWSISDLFVQVRTAGGVRRVPAGELGARLATFNGASGQGALDGNPATRWSSARKRLDGQWVRLELPEPRSDLVAVELEHLPHERDFPNALQARVDPGDGTWTEVPATAATPRLSFHPLIFVLAGLGLLSAGAALRRERAVDRTEPALQGLESSAAQG